MPLHQVGTLKYHLHSQYFLSNEWNRSTLIWENFECGRIPLWASSAARFLKNEIGKGLREINCSNGMGDSFFKSAFHHSDMSTSQNMVCYGWKVSLLNLWISKELVLRTVKEEQSVCKLLYWASWGDWVVWNSLEQLPRRRETPIFIFPPPHPWCNTLALATPLFPAPDLPLDVVYHSSSNTLFDARMIRNSE